MDLRTGDIGVLREPVPPEGGGRDLAAPVDPYVLEERGPECLATPPSAWPRHCMGLMTLPASAACTLRRMRISPVPGSTATRNHWALKATERGEPPQWPSAASSSAVPLACAASYSSFRGTARPAQSKASAPSTHRCRATPVWRAARVFSRSARDVAARRTALPATTVPAEPKAPVSWRTTSVSDCRMRMRSSVVFRA